MNMSGTLSKILWFLTIVFAAVLAGPIYIANNAIGTAINTATYLGANLTSFYSILATIRPYGPILMILGLFVVAGVMGYETFKGTYSYGGKGDLYRVFGVALGLLIILAFFPAIITAFNTVIGSASAAGDTLGTTIFPIIPVLIYVGIMVMGGWEESKVIRKGHGHKEKKAFQPGTQFRP